MRGPYDEIISSAMQSTMKFLCELIPGCSFGYTYSDKIILMISDMERMPGRQKDMCYGTILLAEKSIVKGFLGSGRYRCGKFSFVELSESFREGGQEIGWVVDENPPDFRINKDYVMR